MFKQHINSTFVVYVVDCCNIIIMFAATLSTTVDDSLPFVRIACHVEELKIMILNHN